MNEFTYTMNQSVKISASGETGSIIARAEYAVGGNSYLIRYKAADGRAVENWWNEGAIEAA